MDPFSLFKEITLDCGLKVYMCQLGYSSRVAMDFVVKSGGRDGKIGVSHFLEHYLASFFRDQENEYFKEMKLAGCALSLGATGYNNTSFTGCCPTGEELLLIEFFRRIVKRPPFDRWDIFESDKKTISNEIRRSLKSEKLHEKSLALTSELYGRNISDGNLFSIFSKTTTLGNNCHLQKISLQDLENHYNSFFHPKNAFLLVVGSFDKKKIMQELNSTPFFTDTTSPKYGSGPNFELPLKPNKKVVKTTWKKFSESKMNIVNHNTIEGKIVFAPSHPTIAPFFYSQFVDTLEEKTRKAGIAYSVDSSFHRKEDFNYIRFFFNFKEDSKKAISIIDETFEKIGNDEQSFKEEKQRRIAQSRTIDESIVEIRNVACEELLNQGKIILISEDVATL
jgi:predicted Zn-dependent peptidase